MEKESATFLIQLVKSLEEGELKLEEAYEKKDVKSFNELKKFISQVQEKIDEEV